MAEKIKTRRYSERWSEDKIGKLIEERLKREKLFTKKNFDLKSLWEEIGQALGSQEDWRKIRKRWTNVVCKYKSIIESPTGQGTEDLPEKTTEWSHFSKLFDYFADKHTINPPLIIDSSGTGERSTPSPVFTNVEFLEEEDRNDGLAQESLDDYLSRPSSSTPSTSSSRKRKKNEIEALEEKALKSINKCCTAIQKYLREKHGIEISSESE